MGDNQNILFLLVCVWTVRDAIKEKLELIHTADLDRGFSAHNLICSSQRGNFYFLSVEIIALLWSILLDYFLVVLTVWSALQTKGALFSPFHNFADLSVGFFFHIALCTTQNTGKLPPWNWYGHELMQPWNCMYTALWDWTVFQTASAAQKWAEMEVKWDNNFRR